MVKPPALVYEVFNAFATILGVQGDDGWQWFKKEAKESGSLKALLYRVHTFDPHVVDELTALHVLNTFSLAYPQE